MSDCEDSSALKNKAAEEEAKLRAQAANSDSEESEDNSSISEFLDDDSEFLDDGSIASIASADEKKASSNRSAGVKPCPEEEAKHKKQNAKFASSNQKSWKTKKDP